MEKSGIGLINKGGGLCFIGEVKDCIRAIIVESALGNEVEQRDK